MTTQAEVRRFLMPLCARFPEIVLVGRLAILPPVSHYLRFISIASSGNAEFCEPHRIAEALYVPRQFAIWNLSTLIRPPQRGRWRVRNMEDAATFAETASPQLDLLRNVDTPQAFIALEWADHPPELVPREQLEFPHRLFNGELDRARELLQKLDWLTKSQWQPVLSELGLWDALQENGSVLPADGRRRLAAWFKERERRAVEALKIGHLWIDEPVPVG